MADRIGRAVRDSQFRNHYAGSLGPAAMHDLYDRKRRRGYFLSSTDDISVVRVALEALIREIEPLMVRFQSPATGAIGNGLYLLMGSGASPRLLSTEDYAKILVLAAARIGPERVADLFTGWLEGKRVRVWLRALLKGVQTERRLAPVEGLRLETLPTNGDEFPRSLYVQLDEHDHRHEQYTGRGMLSLEHRVGPALYAPDGDADQQWKWPLPHEPCNEELAEVSPSSLCRAMSLQVNNHVDWFREWWDYGPVDAFFLNPGSSFSRREIRSSSPVTASEEQLRGSIEIDERLRRFRKLDRGIARWRRSKRATTKEERLVELRIALESVLLSDDRGVVGEKRHRLALRGAWLLGKTLEEREMNFRALRDAYDLASTVIHAGSLGEKHERKLPAIDTAQDLCREAILLIAREQAQPKWLEILLGKGLGCGQGDE